MSNLSEEELEAIEDINEMIELNEDKCLITTDYDFKCLEILLNLIEKQQKVIDKMADSMYNRPAYINLPYMKTKEEIKEYFYKEIKNE